jgi:hypothetical protein
MGSVQRLGSRPTRGLHRLQGGARGRPGRVHRPGAHEPDLQPMWPSREVQPEEPGRVPLSGVRLRTARRCECRPEHQGEGRPSSGPWRRKGVGKGRRSDAEYSRKPPASAAGCLTLMRAEGGPAGQVFSGLLRAVRRGTSEKPPAPMSSGRRRRRFPLYRARAGEMKRADPDGCSSTSSLPDSSRHTAAAARGPGQASRPRSASAQNDRGDPT